MEERTAVITGGGGDMGIACARRLASDHRILLAEVDEGRLAAAEEALRAEGVEVTAQALDVADPASVSALAERAAELPDDGEVDFVRSLLRLLELVNREEAPWLALLGLLPLGVILLAEALRGGRGWRWLSLLAVLAALACMGPFLRYRLQGPEPTVMVVAESGLERRREPLPARPVVGRWDPGTELRVIDRLADWHRLEDAAGERGWVSSVGLFDLDR